jgi:protein-S-isoprenylcysteine O-methyltransferase Ste14
VPELQFLATIELLVCWFGWGYPFILRAPHRQKRASVTARRATLLGMAAQCGAIVLAWVERMPAGGEAGVVRILGSMALGPVAALLAWSSVKHLGRQFRVHAGVYEDHELVRTGPYAILRHPIYTSLLALLLSTALLLTEPLWIPISLALYIAGTEIRVHAEDRLLGWRFGEEFDAYRSSVRAYIPYLR